MRTRIHIALRYLFAKKKHNVINIISGISAAGIAIGSMALVIILSVYNGFDNSIREIYESYKADFVIAPKSGKTLILTPEQLSRQAWPTQVQSAHPVIEENVFIKYGAKETIARMKGADSAYFEANPLGSNLIEGSSRLHLNEIGFAILGEVLAYNLGARTRFSTPIELYFPKTDGNIPITNPLESVNYCKIFHGGTLQGQSSDESSLIYVSRQIAMELTGRADNECSSVEVFLNKGITGAYDVKGEIESLFPDCTVKDKLEQNATLYRMMNAERGAIYLILFFITAIISINIFSCLSMMIAEKREDIETFLGLGATKEFVKEIFLLHGTLISLLGCIAGTVIGTALALAQQIFGFITIPGNYILSAFPVEIRATDILLTFVGVSLIGFLISWIPCKKIFKN